MEVLIIDWVFLILEERNKGRKEGRKEVKWFNDGYRCVR